MFLPKWKTSWFDRGLRWVSSYKQESFVMKAEKLLQCQLSAIHHINRLIVVATQWFNVSVCV